VLIVHHVFRPDDSRQALEVGSLVPAHATALGKALLAKHRYLATEGWAIAFRASRRRP
jgi:DNA-binding IclR family transcriptional regulator